MLNRRAFIGTVAGALLAVPLVAEAQQTEKVYRVGMMGSSSGPLLEAFKRALDYLDSGRRREPADPAVQDSQHSSGSRMVVTDRSIGFSDDPDASAAPTDKVSRDR